MILEIQTRIKQIRNSQIPEGYKKTSLGIIPTGWEIVRFDSLFTRLIRRNVEKNNNVLTISAQYGLINQEDFFNKNVASENTENYYLLQKGEFAYNKSYSTGYPFGAVKMLTKYDKGILSPLYICFSRTQENEIPEFYLQYFEAGLLNREIKSYVQEGARNHGLLNIAIDDFFSSRLIKPPLPEQKKIADILSAQTRLIELKEKLLAEKQKQKKYLMQQLLNGKLRIDNGEWKIVKFSEIGTIVSGGTPDTHQKQYWDGNISWCTPSDITKSGKYISKTEKTITEIGLKNSSAIILPVESILMCTRASIGPRCINKIPMATNQGIKSLICNYTLVNVKYIYDLIDFCVNDFKKLASGSTFLELSKQDFENYKINLPPLSEQNAIAEILSTADKEIELLQKDIEQEKLKKKSLMQLLLTGIVRVKV